MQANSNQLRDLSIATRVSFTWLGISSSVSDQIKDKMISTLTNQETGAKADNRSYSAKKTLYKLKLPPLRAMTGIKREIKKYWEYVTLPYTEPGIRLLKRDKLEEFNERMQRYQNELAEKALAVQYARDAIIQDAAQRLQHGFDITDYPQNLAALFGVEWSFPSIDPPDYLKTLNPQVYEQEKQRAESRLNEAIALAESAFLEQLNDLTESLHHSLTDLPDGKSRVLKVKTVSNLTEFFTHFKEMRIGSNSELDAVIQKAEQLIKGVSREDLKDSAVLRKEIASGLAQIKQDLVPLITVAPRRKGIKFLNREPVNASA